MYDTISLDPIPEGVLDGNLAMYDIVPLIYLDGNYFTINPEDFLPEEHTIIVSNRPLESYSFETSNNLIYSSPNSKITLYYDGNLHFFDGVFLIKNHLDGNINLIDNINLIEFFDEAIDERLIIKLNGSIINFFDKVQYLPNDVIVVKCDTPGYYEWTSAIDNGNFLVKSRFNKFKLNQDSLSVGKDHGFVSNYPKSRTYDLQSYFDSYVSKGGYGSIETKTSRTRPLPLSSVNNSQTLFEPVQNIIRDLNNETEQYKINPIGMYLKVVGEDIVAAYSSLGILERLNELIQAVPENIDLSRYPEVTAPFVFINPLAKPLAKKLDNVIIQVLEWPWVTTDGMYIALPNSEQRIKGIVKYNLDYYWVTLEATIDLHIYKIISMSIVNPGFNFEYYRYKFIIMEEHNRSSKM